MRQVWIPALLLSVLLGCSDTQSTSDGGNDRDATPPDDGGNTTDGPPVVDCDEPVECTPGEERLDDTGCTNRFRVMRCNDQCAWEELHPCGEGCGTRKTEPWDAEQLCVYEGTFYRGCDECEYNPTQLVWLPSFLIDRYVVTATRYQRCLDAGGCPGLDMSGDWGRPISLRGAEAFCEWAGGRLPTPEEWEKAARGPAPDRRALPWAQDICQCGGQTSAACEPGYNACDGDSMTSLPSGPVNGAPGTASPFGAERMLDNGAEHTTGLLCEEWGCALPTSSDPLTVALVGPSTPGEGTPEVRGIDAYDYGINVRIGRRHTDETARIRCVYDLQVQ